jgi:gamma-tubulin complex component 2
VDRHVAALQQAAGAAGRAEVTREAVQVLTWGAGQPSQLVKQLAACFGVPQPPGMMHLLERLAAEPEVAAQLVSNVGDKENMEQERPRRRLVGSASAKSFNSPDLRTLQEMLLTKVAKSSAQPEADTAALRRGLLEDRPLFTANFVVPALGEVQVRGQHSVLQGVPAACQESLLLQELLYVLVGCGGRHIVPTRGTAVRPVTFTLDPDIDPSLRALLSRILPLAGH